MNEKWSELLDGIREIRELLRLMAEPSIAKRDGLLRKELREMVGGSVPYRNSVLLMDGTRTQADIRVLTKINKGNLSTLVKKLNTRKLLIGNFKWPKLTISIPKNFFETDAKTE